MSLRALRELTRAGLIIPGLLEQDVLEPKARS